MAGTALARDTPGTRGEFLGGEIQVHLKIQNWRRPNSKEFEAKPEAVVVLVVLVVVALGGELYY
eukprot:3165450-Rhodomonas_salina.1